VVRHRARYRVRFRIDDSQKIEASEVGAPLLEDAGNPMSRKSDRTLQGAQGLLLEADSSAEDCVESGIHAAVATPPDFSSVYTRHFQDVCRWATAFGCASSEVEDVAQEVFLVVRRRLPELEVTNLAGWIYRITRNVSAEHRRRRWFRSLLRRSDQDLELLPSANEGPGDALHRRQAERLFRAALSRMTPKRRAAFYLFEVEGYTGQELAELEGVPLKTIYTRLHHARKDFVALVAAATEGA